MKRKGLSIRLLFTSLLAVVLLAGLAVACTEEAATTTTPATTAPATTTTPAATTPATTEPAATAEPAATTEPETEVIKLIAHTTTAPTAAPGQCLEEWATQLEEMSGGRLEVVRYFSSALFEQKEAVRSMLSGTADVHFDYMVEEDPGLMKLNGYVGLPFIGYTSPAQGTKVFRALLENIPEMKAEFQGLMVLYPVVYTTASSLHSSNKPIQTTEDLKGTKFLALGWGAKWYEAMGATAVNLSWPEFYTGYEKGIIDASVMNWGAHIGSGMIELSKYHTRIVPNPFSIGTVVNFMNPDSFNNLPDDIQKDIEDLDDWYVNRRTEMEAELDIVGEMMASEMGQTIEDLSPEVNQEWVDAAAPIHEEWIEEMESDGVPARQFYEELKRLQAEYE